MENINNTFSLVINYSDESNVWPSIWSSLKSQLNLHFAAIRYKESSVMKPLVSLNIKMLPYSSNQADNIHIHVTKVGSVGNLKAIRDKFINDYDRFKNAFFVFVMDIENSENSLKTCLKNFDKIKTELKYYDIRLLPVNPNFGKLNELVSAFFKILRQKFHQIWRIRSTPGLLS
jgi:hypothetical protein